MAAATIDDYHTTVPAPLTAVTGILRRLLDEELPGAQGAVWHGHPVWRTGSNPVAGYKAYTAHVTLLLWGGADVEDPTGLLQHSGSSGMATVKLRGVDDVDESALRSWLRQLHERGPQGSR